jgi:hypothetical protein
MKKILRISSIVSAMLLIALSTFPAHALLITFEDGILFGLGHGPVSVHDYDFDGLTVSFDSNASYALAPPTCCGAVLLDHFNSLLPIGVTFNFLANEVSVTASSALGLVRSFLTAFGPDGEEVGEDSFTGLPPDLTADARHPYTVTLSVSAPSIHSVVLGGVFCQGGMCPGDNTTAVFDNLSVTPVPEPGTWLLLGSGFLVLIYFRKRFLLSFTSS